MSDEYSAKIPGADGNGGAHRHRNRVWELVRAHGPDVAGLCWAGSALMPDVAGLGLSVGPGASGLAAGSLPQVRFGSDPVSQRLEWAQYTLDDGPCREAAASRRPVRAPDLTGGSARQRWPRFTPAALQAGARAVFALPLHAGAVRHDGAVDLYRRTPGGLGAQHATATAFAAAATELLALERVELDFTDAFIRSRSGVSDPPTHPLAADTAPHAAVALLACWFDQATALAAVRDQVRAISTSQGLYAEDEYRFVLVVHEAVANAVRHGGGHGQLLLWRRDGRLWCEISDHGPGIDATTGHGDTEWPKRHGMWLMQRACTSMDITTDATGTRLLLSYRLEHRPTS